MAEYELHLSIANRLDQVWQVRAAVAALLKELDYADLDILHVQLAVAEAINNCIEHSYAPREHGRVEVVTQSSSNSVRIDIIDDGRTLPLAEIEELLCRPIQMPQPGLPLASGGRGLQIMKSTMDLVTFQREGSRNRLTLVKTLRRLPDTALSL